MANFNTAVYGGISISLHRPYATSISNKSIYISILINKNEYVLFMLDHCVFSIDHCYPRISTINKSTWSNVAHTRCHWSM